MLSLSMLFFVKPVGGGDPMVAAGLLGLLSLEEPGLLGQPSRIVELYDDLRPSLYGYLVCFGLEPQEADDIIQEVFLRLFRVLQSGGEVRNPRSWAFRVAHNLSLNLMKRERRLVSEADPLNAGQATAATTAPNPEEVYLKKEQMRLLDAAMRHLTMRQWQCVHLRAEGLRYREIAEVLGSTPSGVAQSLKRAVERLMSEFYE
jgi:RNA polymerase sigma-70 factor (ECF subfamily)